MSRPIKFRVWDKIENKFYIPDCRCQEGILDDMVIDLKGYTLKRNINSSILSGTTDEKGENRYILMQFTGLHDKNGKEIYEGDIIKDELTGYVCPVEYNPPCFLIVHKELMDDYYSGAMPLHIECEIIGNIYENSELIKESL